MKEEIFEKVTYYIESMAKALGVASEHVYSVLVKQTQIYGFLGIGSVLFFALIILITWLSYFLMRKKYLVKFSEEEADAINNSIPELNIYRVRHMISTYDDRLRKRKEKHLEVIIATTIGLLIFGALILWITLPMVINPEYQAIMKIISQFK